MRALRTSLSLAVVLVVLSACTTPEIERLKRENAAKRVKLDRLLEQLETLEDQVFRQRAELLASRKRLDRAHQDKRVSEDERTRIERELEASNSDVKRLQTQVTSKKAETKRLQERDSASEADRRRRDELSGEIAQLEKQIDVLSKAMRRQAEARAALYKD